jgi:sugar phosphate permease
MCLIATIFHAISSGVYFYGFSVFYTPILLEYGWSSALTAGAFSLSRLEGGLEAPIIGWAIDKYGVRRLMIFGITLIGIGFIAMTQVDSIFMFYLVYAGLLSQGHTIGFRLTPTTLITKWFVKMRSRAMGIWSLGGGIGGAVFVPIIALLIDRFGWRQTAVFIGIFVWVAALPLAFFVRNRPEDMGLLPDGADPNLTEYSEVENLKVKNPESNLSLRKIFRNKLFRNLLIAESLRSVLLSSLVVHQIPYLVSVGVPQATAAGILGLMITLSIPGRFIFGYIGDFVDNQKLIILSLVMQAVGIFIFTKFPGIFGAYAFVVIYGFAYGGLITNSVTFRGNLFGRERYATITGLLSPFRMIGGVLGPIFAGYIFDVYQSYSLAFYTFSGFALLSAITYFFVKPESSSSHIETFS